MENLVKNKKEVRNHPDPDTLFNKGHRNLLNTEKTKCQYQPMLLSWEGVRIGLKNATSYAIGEDIKTLVVVENQTQIRFDRFYGASDWIQAILYIDHLDCYLIQSKTKIYRKDIDSSPPYLFMDIDRRYQAADRLRYSKINKKLILLQGDNNLAVIDLERFRFEMEIITQLSNIEDFNCLALKKTRSCALTNSGRF